MGGEVLQLTVSHSPLTTSQWDYRAALLDVFRRLLFLPRSSRATPNDFWPGTRAIIPIAKHDLRG